MALADLARGWESGLAPAPGPHNWTDEKSKEVRRDFDEKAHTKLLMLMSDSC
jgi:hypothetical protein